MKGSIALELDIRDGTLPVLPVKLHDDVDHGPCIINGLVTAEAEVGLHAHQRQLFERAFRCARMDGADRAGMASVYGAQESDRFGTS